MNLSPSGCYGQVASFGELRDVSHPLNQYLLRDDRISSTAGFMSCCVYSSAGNMKHKVHLISSGSTQRHTERNESPRMVLGYSRFCSTAICW